MDWVGTLPSSGTYTAVLPLFSEPPCAVWKATRCG